MTGPYPIRSITAPEFESFAEVAGEAFHGTLPSVAIEQERRRLELDRTIAAFDSSTVVGTASSCSLILTVPGASAKAAGITMVSVRPAYRGRGILASMITDQLADASDRAEAIAILFASESGIYGRYGFSAASLQQQLRIRRGEGELCMGPAAGNHVPPRLRADTPQQLRAELETAYDALVLARPGHLARDARWWDYLLADHRELRGGMSELRCIVAEDTAGPRGYALYRTKSSMQDGRETGTLQVKELFAADPSATAALWTDLRTGDLIGDLIAPRRPIDDPLFAMLADPRWARGPVTDGLWVRLIDVPTALCQRRYASAVDVVVDVIDSGRPANAGCWRLRSAGPTEAYSTTCERTTASADLRLSVQVLGAGYLGAASFGQLASAGHIAQLTPGALASLAFAMSWDPAPWCPMVF